jgi:hypothetical protein
MQDFDYEKARQVLEIPDNFDVMTMIAFGRRGLRGTYLLISRKESLQRIESPYQKSYRKDDSNNIPA